MSRIHILAVIMNINFLFPELYLKNASFVKYCMYLVEIPEFYNVKDGKMAQGLLKSNLHHGYLPKADKAYMKNQ